MALTMPPVRHSRVALNTVETERVCALDEGEDVHLPGGECQMISESLEAEQHLYLCL